MSAGGYKIRNQEAIHFLTFTVWNGWMYLQERIIGILFLTVSGIANPIVAYGYTAGAL
jgi:hypothetical protein